MIELGKKQVLEVVKKVDFGVYLAEEAGSTDKVLLPKKQVGILYEENRQENPFVTFELLVLFFLFYRYYFFP